MAASLLASSITAGADYRYLHLDVFTDRPLSGNQLAVFLEPGSLTADQMLAITREMAFSETTFVFSSEDDRTAFRVRIFANNLGREIYSRMFGFGVIENPATGNASGPVGSYLVHHEVLTPGEAQHIVSRQGVAMGRPSRVHIRVDTSDEGITAVRVGGGSVVVGEGTVRVSP